VVVVVVIVIVNSVGVEVLIEGWLKTHTQPSYFGIFVYLSFSVSFVWFGLVWFGLVWFGLVSIAFSFVSEE
jgi:hypothetical protein